MLKNWMLTNQRLGSRDLQIIIPMVFHIQVIHVIKIMKRGTLKFQLINKNHIKTNDHISLDSQCGHFYPQRGQSVVTDLMLGAQSLDIIRLFGPSLHHATHATHAAHTGHGVSAVFFRLVGN